MTRLDPATLVRDYKAILQVVLENRPSGTRQRLATALGKNRSFVSQITSPAYAVPIPRRHLQTIFEICHFPPAEQARFLASYNRAHPHRTTPASGGRRMRAHAIFLPDLGDDARNRELEVLVSEFVNGLVRLIDTGKETP